MKYWTIDSVTREIIGSAEHDKWNMPRNVLLVEPLPKKEGFAVIAKADLSGTEYIADHRDKTIYNKEKPTESKQVEKLGDVEKGWTLKKPPTSYHTFNTELDGWELTAQAQAAQLADAIQSSITSIDNTAAAVTSYWTRFATEYEESEKAAIEYKAAGYEGDASVFITSYADGAGVTYKQATDTILQQADGLRSLQASLRAERMRKYALKDPALTLEEITVLRNEIVANIKALGDSYE